MWKEKKAHTDTAMACEAEMAKYGISLLILLRKYTPISINRFTATQKCLKNSVNPCIQYTLRFFLSCVHSKKFFSPFFFRPVLSPPLTLTLPLCRYLSSGWNVILLERLQIVLNQQYFSFWLCCINITDGKWWKYL